MNRTVEELRVNLFTIPVLARRGFPNHEQGFQIRELNHLLFNRCSRPIDQGHPGLCVWLRHLLLLVLSIGLAIDSSMAQDASPKAIKDTLPTTIVGGENSVGLEAFQDDFASRQLDDQQTALGRRLFFDSLLSKDRSVSCATCHQPEYAMASADVVAVGIGGAKGTRNSPSLWNVSFSNHFFWDGRAKSLEDQALQPIENPIEMGTTVETVLARLKEDPGYSREFKTAFDDGLTRGNLAKALASFQRTLLAGNSLADRFRLGDRTLLNRDERRGFWLFESKAGCWKCHRGGNYSDDEFHNTGIAAKQSTPDLGRLDVTKSPDDRGAFKTPSLRNVELTAPYMHDGSLSTLEQVVRFYNEGGHPNAHLDSKVQPLKLKEEELNSLVSFLKTLTSPIVRGK